MSNVDNSIISKGNYPTRAEAISVFSSKEWLTFDEIKSIITSTQQGIYVKNPNFIICIDQGTSVNADDRKYNNHWNDDNSIFYYYGSKKNHGSNQKIIDILDPEKYRPIFLLQTKKSESKTFYQWIGEFRLLHKPSADSDPPLFPLVKSEIYNELQNKNQLYILRDKMNIDIENINESENKIKQKDDFFTYLEEKGLNFDQQLVVNFLLSLKAKPFLILSGGTGTGKTRLAQAYGEFISKNNTCKFTDIPVTIGNSIKNNGFNLNRDAFFSVLPKSDRRLDGEYKFSIGGIEGNCRINMSPRFTFLNDGSNEKVYQKMKELQQISDKTTLRLWLPESKSDKQYSIIPVGSNWTDSRYVIGYQNVISGKYVKTASLDLMQLAEKDAHNPYLLILDEMNLSHVEKYFSDVISCMESNEAIILSKNEEDGKVSTVSLNPNLFIIGTVNMDETTHTFSPKVLDRSNVIEFEPASVSDFLEKEITYNHQCNIDFLQNCMEGLECRTKNSKEIVDILKKSNEKMADEFITILDSIQSKMKAMKLPFGYRTLDEISRFMYVAWRYEGEGPFNNWKIYLDAQVLQKILPKIHGNLSIYKPLEDLCEICENNGLTRSSNKIKQMKTVLQNQRYVSFNC